MRIKGSIVLTPDGKSQIVNAIIDRVEALPPIKVEEAGRIVFHLTVGQYYFNTGAAWQPMGVNSLVDQSDVVIVDPEEGDVIEYDGAYWINSKRSFLYQSSTAAVEHTILHNLNTPVPQVSVYQGGKLIIPHELVIDTSNHITVTLLSAANLAVLVSK